MELFEKTQELRNFGKEINFPVSFANYNCGCDKGVTVFDSTTRKSLFNITEDDTRSLGDIFCLLSKHKKRTENELEHLMTKRNKMSRRISTLKKVQIKNNE